MSTTDVTEIADGLFRLSTPVGPDVVPAGFTFNQFLVVDDEPLLFHTGLRRHFPLIRDAMRRVLPPERLRWISFSHVEADECGALNDWLAVAPNAQAVCSRLAVLVSMNDLADRPPRGLGDGETLAIGRRTLRWLDAPHVPHGMENGYLYDETDRVFLCGDLFTQQGQTVPPIIEAIDTIWETSEATRRIFRYAPLRDGASVVDRLAALEPTLLACMHGSSFRGDGGALLRRLRDAL